METHPPKPSLLSKLGYASAASSIVANLYQVWPALLLVRGTAMTAYSKYIEGLPWSVSVVLGLGAYAFCVWLLKMVIERREKLAMATDQSARVAPATADEDRLERCRAEVLKLASAPRTLYTSDRYGISVETNGQSISLDPPSWTTKTRYSLRALVRQEVCDEYEKVLKIRDENERQHAAEIFLANIARSMTDSDLRS